MEADYQDNLELDAIESLLEKLTDEYNEWIDQDLKLTLVLLEELPKYKIASSLGIKDKFIQIAVLCHSPFVKAFVKDWLTSRAEIKKHEKKIRQLEGKRDSIKKKLSILKERGI